MSDSKKQDKLNKMLQELLKSQLALEKLIAIVVLLVVGGLIVYKCLK